MNRDEGAATAAGSVRKVRIAVFLAGLVPGLAAAVGLFAIAWRLTLVGALAGFASFCVARTYSRGSRTRLWHWLWLGGSLGLGVGSSFLAWVASRVAAGM